VARSLGATEPLSDGSPLARPGWLASLLAYATYVAGVVVATWPLVRGPASLWPDHHDPALFTWVMASAARRLLHEPSSLFDANTFYPHGLSYAFGEILLVPALLGFPGWIAGNPILTYNLLVLLLWPVNGVAMAWAAHEVTGSRTAAWLAGAVFCLSPYFTEYYLEFNMLPAAAVPVAIVAWIRWLERQQWRWLALALGAFTLQGLTTWYYAIILGVGLVTVTLGFCLLRWRDWDVRRDVVAILIGGVAVGAILGPLAWPYWIVHRTFGYERDLTETAGHYADLLSFVEPGDRSRFFPFGWTGHVPETSPFVGFTALLLACFALWRAAREPAPAGGPRWLRRGGLVILVLSLGSLGILGLIRHYTYHLYVTTLRLRPGATLAFVLGGGAVVLASRGWAHWRRRAPRNLTAGDWVRLLALMVAVSVVLALGPVVHVARRAVGDGLYAALYSVLLPLHVIRNTVRFGVLSVAGLGLLAALGWAWLADRLRGWPAVRHALAAALIVALMLEYAVWPLRLVPIGPRPVDAVIRADPDDVAVLEWPPAAAGISTEAMFRSLYHGKRVVNGYSGFRPPLLRDLSTYLGELGPPFPDAAAQDALRRVYGLRYLVVRLGSSDFEGMWRPTWLALRQAPPPSLRFLGSYGADDLYKVVSLPERRRHVERLMSRDMLRRHPTLRLAVSPLMEEAGVDQAVEVRLNGRLLRRIRLVARVATEIPIDADVAASRTAPNVVSLDYVYAGPPGWRDAGLYRIGRTGAQAPGDLYVVSVGQLDRQGRSALQLNGRELGLPGRPRGYNLVALDPKGGTRAAAGFDTNGDSAATAQLADWVAELPPGTIVMGAVSDEASAMLGADAVRALGTLGVLTDMRGRFRESHAFVGVKGAPPGSALEVAGPREVELRVGSPDDPAGFLLTEFALAGAPNR
jgi:hypothetical protein